MSKLKLSKLGQKVNRITAYVVIILSFLTAIQTLASGSFLIAILVGILTYLALGIFTGLIAAVIPSFWTW